MGIDSSQNWNVLHCFSISCFFLLIVTSSILLISVLIVFVCLLGKNVWAELVGIKSKIAEHIVKKDNSNVERVETFLARTGVTKDFRSNRVRLFVNIKDEVVVVPRIG